MFAFKFFMHTTDSTCAPLTKLTASRHRTPWMPPMTHPQQTEDTITTNGPVGVSFPTYLFHFTFTCTSVAEKNIDSTAWDMFRSL